MERKSDIRGRVYFATLDPGCQRVSLRGLLLVRAETPRLPAGWASGSPARSLGDGLFELRFNLGSNAQRITFFFPGDRRAVLLTTFHKQRQNERAEVARARLAMEVCVGQGHTVEEEGT